MSHNSIMKLKNLASWKLLNLYFYQQETGQIFFSQNLSLQASLVLDVKKQL